MEPFYDWASHIIGNDSTVAVNQSKVTGFATALAAKVDVASTVTSSFYDPVGIICHNGY